MPIISDLYKEYQIMPNLELHMLRVASVAKLICLNLNNPLSKDDEEDIIKALLLHDFGNLIKVDFSLFPKEFYDPQGIDFWRDLQKIFKNKYGDSDHEANILIAKEIGASDKVLELIDELRFASLCKHLETGSLGIQILAYSDLRVGPYGVLSYQDRMDEADRRYQNKYQEQRKILLSCGEKIEEIIFKNCKITKEDINDNSISKIMEELKNFVI